MSSRSRSSSSRRTIVSTAVWVRTLLSRSAQRAFTKSTCEESCEIAMLAASRSQRRSSASLPASRARASSTPVRRICGFKSKARKKGKN